MDVVAGVSGLEPRHGPIFAVVGVFDGLHRGHAYLLEHLVSEARARGARPCVITFDHHPDEVLTGSAPPLLVHPDERLERLEEAGVEVTVVQPFDDEVRRIPYDAFIAMIEARCAFAGLLMTPDAAFGFERQGTPATLTELGAERGFDCVVVPPFALGDRPVRSSEIRAAISSGDLEAAAELLGRAVTLRGIPIDGELRVDWPQVMPPDGDYRGSVAGRPVRVQVRDGRLRLPDDAGAPGAATANGHVTVTLDG